MAGKPARSRIGLFSRASAVRDVDGRTAEARIIKSTVRELTDHVGGNPTAAQRLLIQATATLVLRLRCALDRYVTGDDPETLDRHVVSLQNALRLNLVALGLERPKDQAPSLSSYLELRAKRVA